MRRLLLDTHILLWWLSDASRIGPRTLGVIHDGGNTVFVSAASAWEMSIKRAQGKLKTPRGEFSTVLAEEGFVPLPITIVHGELAGQLPPIHRDPFDRMLVAQAMVEGLEIVTVDPTIPKYGVSTIVASA